MKFTEIFSLFRRFIRGNIGLASLLLALLGILLAWLISTSFSGIVEDKAVSLFNAYIVALLVNRWVPVWVLCLLLPSIVVVTFGVGIIVGRKNPLTQSRRNSLADNVLNLTTGDDSLFQALIDEVEENPTGLPHGKLWRGVIQVSKKEISDQEFAAQVVTILNNEEINEKTARKFLGMFGFSLKHKGSEYYYVRKSYERRSS